MQFTITFAALAVLFANSALAAPTNGTIVLPANIAPVDAEASGGLIPLAPGADKRVIETEFAKRANGYAASCTSVSLQGVTPRDVIMSATCKTTSGSTVRSGVSLNSCLGNSNGGFVCKKGGNAWLSCDSFGLSGTFLSAICSNTSGGGVSTSIDLNNCIGNSNGQLVC
ncbi:Cyanovirin-N [Auriculariales sp. MPI-PUGE-AT-0066]|nr:Cyanovirin-N [Auriculariales sp. MPI-PUGE-AT-0066]